MPKKWKLKIIYNKAGCVSSGHCVLADPYDFKLDAEFKADLVDGKPLKGANQVFEKIIETEQPHLAVNAAKTCTPRVIAVIDMETGKRIDLTGYGKMEGEEGRKAKEMDVEKRIAKQISERC